MENKGSACTANAVSRLSRRDVLGATAGVGAAATLGALGSARRADAAVNPADIAWDDSADVVVIGLGTGMAAVIGACEAGASVIALEKLGRVGGDWAINTGAVWAPATDAMKAMGGVSFSTGEEDTFEGAMAEWVVLSHGDLNRELAEAAMRNAQAFVNSVYNEGGHTFHIEAPSGKGDYPRAHYLLDEDGNQQHGNAWTSIVADRLEATGATLMMNTMATEILCDDNDDVVGVVARDVETGAKVRIGCKAVVVATGGYSSNNLYRKMFNPETEGWAVYGGSQSTGDGYTMLFPHGATLAGFATVQSGPTVEVNTLQAPITCNPNIYTFFEQPRSFMIVNSDGKRHYDETVIAIYVDNAAMSGTFYEIFDQAQVDEEDFDLCPNWGRAGFLEALEDGRVNRYETIEELADAIYVEADVLRASIEAYNEGATSGNDEFGRAATSMRPLEAPYYVATIVRAIGGPSAVASIKIDADARVVDAMGYPLKGIYGASHDMVEYNLRGRDYFYCGTGAGMGYGVSLHAGQKAAEYALGR